MDDKPRCRKSLQWLIIACLVTLIPGRPGWAQETDQPPDASEQEKLGVAPEDYSHEFLRQESVLLKPGQWQLDIGLNYTVDDHRFTDIILPDVIPVDSLLRRRLLVMPLQVRWGLTERMQMFADMPVGWTNTEISSFGFDSFSNAGGIGDASVGFSYMLRKSDGWYCHPDIVATCGFTAPTSNSNILATIFGTPQTTLGQGVWAGFWSVLFIHTYDPVVVFYGFGSRHAFAKKIEDVDVRPGDQYTYRGGVGFTINERITLSAMLYGYYITEPRLDGERLPGTIQEPVYLRFATTMMRPQGRICEPFAEIGVTNDAADVRFGVTWTF